MTINKGKRPIKRELRSQELKIPAQQNRKGNEKIRSLARKCVLAHAGDSAFPRWGRRPSLLTVQVEWTMTNTVSLNCQGRTQLLEVAFSYLGTKNFIGKLCCLPSFPWKGSLEKPLLLWVSFHLFKEMVCDLSLGWDGPAIFELIAVNFREWLSLCVSEPKGLVVLRKIREVC